jgi:hypothetical protein
MELIMVSREMVYGRKCAQVEPFQGQLTNHDPTQEHPPGMHVSRAQPSHGLEDLPIATWLQKARSLLGVRVVNTVSHKPGGLEYVMDACTF